MDCEGSAAGRGHDYNEEMYVDRKPISPSEDYTGRRTGRSTRCQGPPPCTSPRPVSPVAAAARSTTVAKFDHEMVLTSAGCNQTEVSSQPRPSPAGLNPAAAAIESVRGDGSKES